MSTKENAKENKLEIKEKLNDTITSDHTITITPDDPMYETYAKAFATYGTAPLEGISWIANTDKPAEKCKECRPADVPYEKYFKLEHDNKVLKEIIVELNKKLFDLEGKLMK